MHGKMASGRDPIVTIEEFKQNPYVKILVTSDLAREGHDVEVRYIVNFDLLWNPAHMEQRAGRGRRFTSEFKNIVVFTLIADRTVEQYMFDKKLEPKRKLMTEFMDDGDEGPMVTREAVETVVGSYRG